MFLSFNRGNLKFILIILIETKRRDTYNFAFAVARIKSFNRPGVYSMFHETKFKKLLNFELPVPESLSSVSVHT